MGYYDLTMVWSSFEQTLYMLLHMGLLSLICMVLFLYVQKHFITQNQWGFRVAHRERWFLKSELVEELCWPLFNAVVVLPTLAVMSVWAAEVVVAGQDIIPARPLGPWIESLPVWVQVVLGLFVLDLTLYIRHRFVHTYCWSFHTIHHAAREITWSTTLRLHPLDTLSMSMVAAVVLYFIGFEGPGIAAAATIQFHWNRFVHSNLELDFPAPLRHILVSPNMHRWHHAACDEEALDKNFAIMFAFIDLAFGTFYVPELRTPEVYGVVDERGEQVVAKGFWVQLLYPFKVAVEALKRTRT